MTAQQIEYPAPPWVELYTPTPTEDEVRLLTASNAATKPEDAWRNALAGQRLIIIEEARRRLAKEKVLSESVIRDVLDIAWQLNVPILQRATGPMIAEAYIRAFRKAKAGDVPIKMIYALAQEHVKRTGDYFNGTSSDALIQGFNTYVNRQVPERAALARVLDAYGLTPRQMSGLTSAKAFDTPVQSGLRANIKRKVKGYIARSIEARLNLFTRQEAHNLDQQAQQVAWMWMRQHGKIPKTAEKMWITAKDEKVCSICGPLHRTKIPVGDRFILEDGQKLYVPGAHPNCRCTVRLQIPVLELVGKAEQFDPKEHPRGTAGRFVRARPRRDVETDSRFADPQLEAMVRQAQRIEEQEREKARQQIEETPVTPQFKAPQQFQAPSFAAPQQFKAPQAFRAPQAQPQPRVQAAARPSLAAAAIRGFRAPTQQQEFQATSQAIFRAPVVREQQLIPVPARRRKLRPTIRFIDHHGNPQPVYMVVPTNETPVSDYTGANRFFIDRQDELRSWDPVNNHEQIAREIQEQFEANVDTKVSEILERAEYEGYGTLVEDQQGDLRGMVRIEYPGADERYFGTYTELNEDTVSQLVKWAARRGPETYSQLDEPIKLQFFHTEGDPVDDDVTVYLQDLANSHELAIDPGELNVLVVRMQEGYEEGFDMDPGSRYGEETWSAPGNYLIDRVPTPALEPNIRTSAIPVEYWDLTPEVEDTELTDEGWTARRFQPPHGSD